MRCGRAPNPPSTTFLTDVQGISDKIARDAAIYNETYQSATLAKIAKQSK